MLALPFQYLYWHYTTALARYGVNARSYLWYVGHMFSVGFLLRTLFAPWKRRDEQYQGGGIEQYFEAIVVTFLSRVVGVVIRLPIIVTGCVAWLCTVVVVGVGFVLWLALPALLVGMLLVGSYLIYV